MTPIAPNGNEVDIMENDIPRRMLRRLATRDEVLESFDSGLAIIREGALRETDSAGALRHVDELVRVAMQFVPAP
jgi:hypothetical protein